MIANRYGEQGHPPFRSVRMFSQNGQWYFDTREGAQVGPYRDLKAVKNALAVFIAQRLLISEGSRAGDMDYTPGSQEGIEDLVEELYEFFREYKLKGQTAAMLWGNQRLRELMRSREDVPELSARMEAIRYALNLDEL